jgi:proline iminopeptidase
MFVSVKGADLYYSMRGKGPVCLVLSSIGTPPYEFQMPVSLCDRLTLAIVALRGSGESTGEFSDLTFDVLTSDLEAIRHHIGADRVSVLGHSILGVLAIEYGRRCPVEVSHVIAVGTPPKADMRWLSAKSMAYFEKHASEERKQMLSENMAKLSPDTDPSQAILAQTPMRFFDARFDAKPTLANAIVKPHIFPHLLGPLTADWDVTVDSDSLRSPIFIAQGLHDYIVPHVLWDGIAQSLPAATLRVFERSGHQPFFEEPDYFTESVLGWMNRHQ